MYNVGRLCMFLQRDKVCLHTPNSAESPGSHVIMWYQLGVRHTCAEQAVFLSMFFVDCCAMFCISPGLLGGYGITQKGPRIPVCDCVWCREHVFFRFQYAQPKLWGLCFAVVPSLSFRENVAVIIAGCDIAVMLWYGVPSNRMNTSMFLHKQLVCFYWGDADRKFWPTLLQLICIYLFVLVHCLFMFIIHLYAFTNI